VCLESGVWELLAVENYYRKRTSKSVGISERMTPVCRYPRGEKDFSESVRNDGNIEISYVRANTSEIKRDWPCLTQLSIAQRVLVPYDG
jgi:hypothetical protein